MGPRLIIVGSIGADDPAQVRFTEHDETPRPAQETAALPNFDPADDRYGSIANEEAEAARPRMSALRPTADRHARVASTASVVNEGEQPNLV
jgi:hypothetical protein